MNTDYSKLPTELLDQLSVYRHSGTQPIVYQAMTDEQMSIDDVLIAVWKRTKAVYKRQQVTNALHNLVQKNFVRKCGRGYYIKVSANTEDAA